MKKIIIASTVCCLLILLSHASTLASGSGHHAHGDDEVRSSDRNTSVTYKDTQDGIEAFLEFSDFEKINQDSSHNFFMKCSIRVFLKDPKSGKYLQPSKIVLRATTGHDQFGKAVVFAPDSDNRMKTELFVKEKGEQHYLLIAEVEGVGVKEFHFHHTF